MVVVGVVEYDFAIQLISSICPYCSPGKITDLLVKGVVDAMTKMVLVNAIYFKGNWSSQFKEEFTQDARFRLNKVTHHEVDG